MHRLVFVCAIAGAIAGCSKHAAPATPAGNTSGSGSAAASGSSAEAHKPPETVTLKDVQTGDESCYLTVDTQAGEAQYPAEFELCPGSSTDATPMIGKKVTITWTKGDVLSASCEGNVDCGKSDHIDIVDSVKPAS